MWTQCGVFAEKQQQQLSLSKLHQLLFEKSIVHSEIKSTSSLDNGGELSLDSRSSTPHQIMVETTPGIIPNRPPSSTTLTNSRASSPNLSASHPSNFNLLSASPTTSNYLTTAMLLTSQNCNYLAGQLKQEKPTLDHHETRSGSQSPVSLRPVSALNSQAQTILLGRHGVQLTRGFSSSHNPNKVNNNGSVNTTTNPNSLFTIDSILAPKFSSNPSSPQSPPTTSSPPNIRPTRVVPAMLHHPGLHLGHLAAAASGFGTTSDFLGMKSY